MSKKVAPITTSMSETIKNYKPPTEAEKRQAMEDWANRTLETLIEFSSVSSDFKTNLYQSVIDSLSDDEKTAIKMAERIKLKRKNKKGQPRKWTHAQYRLLLMMYNFQQNQGSTPAEALEYVKSVFTKINGPKTKRTINNCLSKAREIINEEDLAPEFREHVK